MKESKCRICRTLFLKRSMTHKVCSPECAKELAQRERVRRERAESRRMRNEFKERREALKTRSEYMKEAQIAFNAYIRARDAGKPCICCGQPLASGMVGGDFDCGHYRSVGSAPHLRFDENNAHGQRKQCNRWGAGRAVDYRIGLIERIGREAVEALEADQAPRKYSIDDLKAIKSEYKKKLKDLKEAA